MCESNVYLLKNGQEELFLEKVDRIIPGEDQILFLESIFGERRVIKASIREMELVHHRIVIEEIREAAPGQAKEIWLEPDTNHGHFHEGEVVSLKLLKGYNMKVTDDEAWNDPEVKVAGPQGAQSVEIHMHEATGHIHLSPDMEGLIQVYAVETGDISMYAKLLVEVGHHHHHGLDPIGLPLEIIPYGYAHARMGENYEIQVLKNGQPLSGVEVKVTYSSTHNRDYPHCLTTDEEGRARIFLSAKGNYLFSVTDDNIRSTFTLAKSY